MAAGTVANRGLLNEEQLIISKTIFLHIFRKVIIMEHFIRVCLKQENKRIYCVSQLELIKQSAGYKFASFLLHKVRTCFYFYQIIKTL